MKERLVNLKERIENNIAIWLLSTAVAGFLAGFGAYKGILEIAKLEIIPKVELEKLKSDQSPRFIELEAQLKAKDATLANQEKRYKEELEEINRTVIELKSQLQPKGVDVNVIQRINDSCYLIKTYERGVFGVTKSCGTGSFAAYLAISSFKENLNGEHLEFRGVGGSHWVFKNNNYLNMYVSKASVKIKQFKNQG